MKYALIAFMIGAFFFGLGRYGLKQKPHENSLINARAKAPVQIEIASGTAAATPLQLEYQKQRYTLYPRAHYAMEGLIVSEHRSDSVWDISHARWGDSLNSRDICTVWGRTLAGSGYRELEFWSGDWTCYYRYTKPEVAAMFDPTEVSNTHVLASDPAVRAALDRLEIGDEYRMRGMLVDYEIAGGGRRATSLVRTDTDNGACEVLYVESVEVLKSHNAASRVIRNAGAYLAVGGVASAIGIMIRAVFFPRVLAMILIFLFGGLLAPATAQAKLCNASEEFCGDGMGSSASATSSASRGSKIRINPAVVSVARGFGVETIFYDSEFDFALVRGLGRIGAAISPSNSEETFFGPPGFEMPHELLDRKRGQHKFPNQKVTLATAVNLFDNRRSGFDRVALNLGVMGKYNRKTGSVRPGGGLSGSAGFFTFGYSLYGDETEVDSTLYGGIEHDVFRYNVETFSVGAFMGIFAVDYSMLRIDGEDAASVSVLTTTMRIKRSLLTAAMRTNKFLRPTYDYETDTVALFETKNEYFGGVQIAVFDPLLVGVFYNYYLMRGLSVGATLFF